MPATVTAAQRPAGKSNRALNNWNDVAVNLKPRGAEDEKTKKGLD